MRADRLVAALLVLQSKGRVTAAELAAAFRAFDEDESAQVFVGGGPGRIGSTYTKCLYRAYTDASFRRRVARPASDAYLGVLGPVIRAEVGDTIRVVYRNRCSFPTSMHPHGVFYDKASEGAPYADGTSGARKADDAVPPASRTT